ncbi:MAG: hypothetical protein WBA91_06390 [Paracoccaceae bacterium]
MKLILPVALTALIAPFPLAAATKFQPPQGCTAYVTVQHSDCQISYHYRCNADAEGDQWAVYAGPDGPYYMSRIDYQTRWMESHDLITPDSDALAEEVDPANFSELLAQEVDTFDFTTVSATGEKRRYAGFDRLTGKSITIDGISFDQTEFSVESFAADGTFLHRRSGNQLISRDWRIFFSDTDHFENAFGDIEDSNSRPMDFAFPDDPGFLSTRPQFGCDMMVTRAEGATLHPASYSVGGAAP